MALCLTNDELYELTGYKRGAEQARWLRGQGYYVECNARGIPRITHVQVEEKRRPAGATQQETSARQTEPNVLAFRQKLKPAA